MLAQGSIAPDFVRTDHRGRTVDTVELRSRGPLVVFFYPRDFTPGCTREACSFRDAHADLVSDGVSVVGISGDDDASHARFAKTHDLPYALVSDADRSLARAFGVLRAGGFLGTRRVTFVIEPSGRIEAVHHGELSMHGHIDAVREALARLRARGITGAARVRTNDRT